MKAGVSKSLASRAFVNPGRVGAQSLKRIREAADDLGYRPNWSARTLNSSDGGFVGIVISDLYSPALAPIVIGAQRHLESAGLNVVIAAASLSEPGTHNTLEEAPIAFLGDLRPSRLLIIGGVRNMESLTPLASRIPTVVAGSRDSGIPAVAEVFTDDESGMDEVIGHLKGLGHRRIAHLAGIGKVGEARKQAYEHAMVKQGLSAETTVELADFEEDSGYEGTRRLLALSVPPTAIVAAGDPAAVGALAAVRESNQSMSIVGYGNVRVANFQLTRLTTVDPNNQYIGAVASDELLKASSAGDGNPRQIRIRPNFVKRATTKRASS